MELLESELANPGDDGRHDALPPERLGQPVADLGPVRLTELEIIEAADADQGSAGVADGPMDRSTLVLGDSADESQPLPCVGRGIGERNAQGPVVEFPVVQVFPENVRI